MGVLKMVFRMAIVSYFMIQSMPVAHALLLNQSKSSTFQEQGVKPELCSRYASHTSKRLKEYSSTESNAAIIDNINMPAGRETSERHRPLADAVSIEAQTLSYIERWRTGVWGNNIGISGITCADVDLDGTIEMILGGTSTFGSNNFWYILEYSPIEARYRMEFLSNLYPERISQISAFDLDGNGTLEILVCLLDARILIYDSSSLAEINQIASPAGYIQHIEFADGDNDSQNEIIFCDSNEMFFYDRTTLTLEHRIPFASSDFEVGNVDWDAANEIVTGDGRVVEFDGLTTTIEWDYSGGDFGHLVELSDIDSDGIQEIVGTSSRHEIVSFDADIQSQKWQIASNYSIDALLMSDLDGDGLEEVLCGEGLEGEIYCYDAVDLTERGHIENPDSGVTNIAVCDTDNDGNLEILWGAGQSSSGDDHLYIHGIPGLGLEWQTEHFAGPFHAIDVGDVDSDGRDEIVYASSEIFGSVIFIVDAVTHALEWMSTDSTFGGYAWNEIHDVRIGDVDDDGQQELVVATASTFDGAVYIINGKTYELENSYHYDTGCAIYNIRIADIDNDGQTEIIAGGGSESSGAPGVYVYIIDGSTGSLEWKSINLGIVFSDIYDLEVGDVDNDGVSEIVAIDDSIFVIDGVSHRQWQSTFGGCLAMDLYDVDGDGVKDIIVGTISGSIIVLDGQNYSLKLNVTVDTSPIVGLQAYDIGQDGTDEIIYGSEGKVKIFGIQDSAILWQSELIGTIAGERNGLVVAQISSRNQPEFIVGTDYSVVEFGRPLLTQIACASPANESVLSSPPTFSWTADGGSNNVFAVDMAFSVYGPFYSTWEHLRIPITSTEWMMPQNIWNWIPSQSYVFWKVRGADRDQIRFSIIYSDAIWFFYKR